METGDEGRAGGTFRTKEKGLFVQQYLPAGTAFTGEISFSMPESGFCKAVHTILTSIKSQVNGTLFEPREITVQPKKGSGPLLVTSPLPWNPASIFTETESLTIGTMRRYAPALGRPRRGKPTIMPGSVLAGEEHLGTVAWPMFGKPLQLGTPKQKDVTSHTDAPHRYSDWVMGMKDTVKGITRSQAGILRELLNPDHNEESIGKYIDDIFEKHHAKSEGASETKLYAELRKVLKGEKPAGLRKKITDLLEYLKAEVWWKPKNADKGGDSA